MEEEAVDVPTTLLSLPNECLVAVLRHLPVGHVNDLSSVSKAYLERIRACAELWEHYVKVDFPMSDATTLCLAKNQAIHYATLRGDTLTTAWIMYRVLARQRSCQRCQLDYCDGSNTPASCRFHTGVLFSGGRLNGNGLVWSCCNKRSYHTTTFQRHANGCTSCRHVGGGRSLWAPDGVDCRPRPLLEHKGSTSSCCSKRNVDMPTRHTTSVTPNSLLGAWSGSSTALEWHPDRYPGGVTVSVTSTVVFADAQTIQICY